MKTTTGFITFALLMMYNATQAQTSSLTPDAIIRQCPTLPTVKQLVNSINTQGTGPEIEAFEAKVVILRENAAKILKEAEEQANEAGQKDAEQVAKQFTGHTASEIDKMTDEEQEAMVNNMLSSFGLGNLSLDNLEALADKSDEEILAAVSKKGSSGKSNKSFDGPVDPQNAPIIMQSNTELQKINARWREFFEQIRKEEIEMEKQIAAIDAKYAPRVFAIKPTIPLSGEMGGWDFTEAEKKARENLIVACRTEQFTLWRNHTMKILDRIKTVMTTEVPNYDKLMKQFLTASGMASSAPLTPSSGYSFAIEYLYTARAVTGLPGIEMDGVLGESEIRF